MSQPLLILFAWPSNWSNISFIAIYNARGIYWACVGKYMVFSRSGNLLGMCWKIYGI